MLTLIKGATVLYSYCIWIALSQIMLTSIMFCGKFRICITQAQNYHGFHRGKQRLALTMYIYPDYSSGIRLGNKKFSIDSSQIFCFISYHKQFAAHSEVTAQNSCPVYPLVNWGLCMALYWTNKTELVIKNKKFEWW